MLALERLYVIKVIFFPGGILILEAQGYSSYHKKRKLTPKIFENFQSIQLMPDQFPDFLLNEVGFTTFHTVAVPKDASKGFQRPIQVRYRFSSKLLHLRNWTMKKIY